MFLEETGKQFVFFSVLTRYKRKSLNNSQSKDLLRSVTPTLIKMLRSVFIWAIGHFAPTALFLCTMVRVGVVDFSGCKNYHFEVTHLTQLLSNCCNRKIFTFFCEKACYNSTFIISLQLGKVTLSLLHKIQDVHIQKSFKLHSQFALHNKCKKLSHQPLYIYIFPITRPLWTSWFPFPVVAEV
jgi:hypothetical protein